MITYEKKLLTLETKAQALNLLSLFYFYLLPFAAN